MNPPPGRCVEGVDVAADPDEELVVDQAAMPQRAWDNPENINIAAAKTMTPVANPWCFSARLVIPHLYSMKERLTRQSPSLGTAEIQQVRHPCRSTIRLGQAQPHER